MKQYRLILLALACFVVLFSCKKDKTPGCSTPTGSSNCEEIQNVKHFFYFKVGSWWVYEEETSGDLDTVYVTEAAHNPSNYNFDVRVYSTYQDYYYHFWPEYFPGNDGCPETGFICKRCLSVKRSKYKPGDFINEAKCMFFIPTVGESDANWNSQYQGNIVIITAISDSFMLDSFLFERTIKVFEDNTVMEDYQPTNHYFSESVGLIRKELLDSNEVWNLIDFYIQP